MFTLFLRHESGDLQAIKIEQKVADNGVLPCASPRLKLSLPASYEDRVMFDARARHLARLFFKNHGLRFHLVSDFSRHLDILEASPEEE